MFTIFDIIILTIITISSICGMYTGLIIFSINLLGFILSIISAFYLYPFIVDVFTRYCSHEVTLVISSGTLSYIISLIFYNFLMNQAKLMVANIRGGILDRLLGLFVGFVRGLSISVTLFVMIAIFTAGSYIKADNLYDISKATKIESYPAWLTKSLITEYLDSISRNILSLFSEESLKSIELPSIKNTQDALDVIKDTNIPKQERNDYKKEEIHNKNLEEELDEMLK